MWTVDHRTRPLLFNSDSIIVNLIMKREYSVLFPLVHLDGEWKIVFEQRSRTLKSHKGEISLPGGAIEENESPLEAAVRETVEELGIGHEAVQVLKGISGTRTLNGSRIHCYVGLLTTDAFAPSDDEVEELIFVPLRHILHHPLSEELLQSPQGNWVKSYYCDFQRHRIWGITGRLIKNFVDSFDMIRQNVKEMSYRSEEI